MYNYKNTLADYVNFSPSPPVGSTATLGEISNNSNQTIEVLLQIDDGDRRGAGTKNGQEYYSKVAPGNSMDLDDFTRDHPDYKEYKCIYRMEIMPSKDEVEGIKVQLGDVPGSLHDVSFVDRNDGSYELIFHYQSDQIIRPMGHVDPEIKHPENG